MSEIPYMMANTRAEFERVRDLAWPTTDRARLADPTDARFTATQREQLEAFEGADAAPETFDPIAALRRVEEWLDSADDIELITVTVQSVRAALAPQAGEAGQ